MLLELAIGDAYGAGFEYAPDRLVDQHNQVAYYIQHPRHQMPPGSYTDDTQMSLAIAEALISGEPWTPANLANRFVDVYARDPRPGYSTRFYELLQRVHSGTELLAAIEPESDRSGAAMRAAPLGVLATVDEVMERCRVQAAITHNTRDGIDAARAAAVMTHYFLYGLGPKSQLGTFIERHVPGPWSVPWQGKVGAKGWMSVRAAITAVVRNRRYTDLLKDCIAFTGDVDTVATLAMAAASCSAEFERDLPQALIAGLENGAYGRDYLARLDNQLLALWSAAKNRRF
jgi:ADP-ribosylglycohydrolase